MAITEIEAADPIFNVFFQNMRTGALVSCNLDPKNCGYLEKTKFTLKSFCTHPNAPKPDAPHSGRRICKTKSLPHSA